MSEPEPVNEEPGSAVEVRGGDRPEDYMPRRVSGMFGHHEDDDSVDADEEEPG